MSQYISEKKIISNMRQMAWERAKGELQSMLHTFWGEHETYSSLKEEINTFIKTVEDEGLHE